ncbi:HAD family hydrolase [Bradyrhizobium diazoefficiens]|uniref:Uncharacterized protein n=1 Tax=Bradyrhizobium diazoefficiens TaxID=1355477 RepID=A0A810B3A6_9BRAD|nr:hypothetical protein XF8B_03520 [Bradyrhizobium diazoefficiens]
MILSIKRCIADTSYDAEAAGKAGVRTIGVLWRGFTEQSLRLAGCVEVYPGPASLFARFKQSLLAERTSNSTV